MYLGYYGLNKEPFHVTPDPEFLFPSDSHKEAFAALVYGVKQRKGFVMVTGEVGTGKTTVLRSYLKQIKHDPIVPVYVFNPALTFEELLRILVREMGEEPGEKSPTAMLGWLQEELIKYFADGRNIVLIIDEAHNMPGETLEQLRMLSNLETTEEKLLQIVLVGQPELLEKLEGHNLRQLHQRIAVRANIVPFTKQNTLAYIQHRVTQAGGNYNALFTAAALKRIVKHARGNPRSANMLCDNVLLSGFGAQQRPVSRRLVREVISDLDGKKSRRVWLRWAPAAAAFLLVAGALAFPWLRGGGERASGPGRDFAPAERSVAHADARVPVAGSSASRLAEKPNFDAAPAPAPISTPQTDSETPAADDAEAVSTEAVKESPLAPTAPAVQVARVQKPSEADTLAEESRPQLDAGRPAQTEPDAVTLKEAPAKVEADTAPLKEAPATAEADAAPLKEAPATAEADAAPPEALPVLAELDTAPLKGLRVGGLLEEELARSPAVIPMAGPAVRPAHKPSPAPVSVIPPGERLTIDVKSGDNLTSLLHEYYGYSDRHLVEEMTRLNPRLSDPNLIYTGDQLVFPAQPKSGAPKRDTTEKPQEAPGAK